jgi:hypothetical protein
LRGRDRGSASTLIDFAEAIASDLLRTDCESLSAIDGARMDVRELLLVRRFGGDPSLSVKQAAEVLSGVLGVEITIAGAARLLRREFEPSDPQRFPGEQALRA